MDRWQGKIAVVTGASAGIGANICKRFVEEGLQVVGLARRVDRVQELAQSLEGKSGKLYAVKCDVTNQEEVQNAFKWVKDTLGTVQILINNAGVVRMGKIIDGDPNDWKTVLDTNVMGLCMCTREAFLQMKEAEVDGHIVHINSVAGHNVLSSIGPMYFNMYSPSKHAVTCLTEVMRKEITSSKANVKITSLSPGAVKTEIAQAAGIPIDENPQTDYPILQCDDVTDSVIFVISTPPHVHIQELTIRPMGEDFP